MTHRQMIVLMLEGFSYAEIGEVLGITENNVAVRLSRARKALKHARSPSENFVLKGASATENRIVKTASRSSPREARGNAW
jgi:transcriptional regulator